MAQKKDENKIKKLVLNGLLVIALIIFVSVTAATIRFLTSGGEKKPFFIPEKNTLLTGVDMSVLKSTYGGKYKEYLGRFDGVDNEKKIPHLTLEEAAALYLYKKVVFIDARSEYEYNISHIAGAINIPPGKAHELIPAYSSKLKNKYLVVYCHGAGCHLSDKTADKLFEQGYHKTAVFFGGWNQWVGKDYPIEKPTDIK